ncbi:hypothetical protein ACLOAV_010776 [Pseudogymnoascus australis]
MNDFKREDDGPSAEETELGTVLTTNPEYNLTHGQNQLERGLKSRHIQFLALGGAIGTGLFVGSGGILADTGPAPLFMAYLSMMGVVWCVMNNLAEMVTYLPMKGISVPYFVDRFVDPSLSFAAGWNYWYAYAMLVAAEASAAAIVLDYWKAPVHVAVWITIVLVIILLLNVIAVSFFGEAEFWFASIKLITILGLILLGIILFFGGGPNHDRLGFRYWQDPGAFKKYMSPNETGKFLAYWHAFVKAGFAFITSPELIAIAAGETVDPRRNIPKAAKRFVFRLAIFYGFASLIIGVIVSSDNPKLNGKEGNATASPFVIGIQETTKWTVNVNETAALMTYTNEVEKYLKDKPSIAYLDCFKRSDLRRTEIACVVWVTQQVCGTSLLGWAAYFYEQAGLQTNDAFSLSVGTYGLAVVGNVVSWFLMRRVGRRRLYLGGLLAMLITLLAIGGVGVAPKSRGQSWTLGSLLLVLTFIYHLTIGPVCFVLVAEIPSTRLRVKTAVLARAAYNLAGILINWMTQRMLSPTAWDWKGKSGFFFAGTTFLCLVYCYWRLPETLGLSYLEIDILFERKAKISKFRELQINLDSLGYFSMEEAERDQLPFRGY